MPIFRFLLGNDFYLDLNVVNSKGEIQAIEELITITKGFLTILRKHGLFIDNASGDIYEYNTSGKDWTPIMNIGLHNVIIAEKYMYRGKYVLNKTSYRPESSKGGVAITGINTEIHGVIYKQYLSHPLLKNI